MAQLIRQLSVALQQDLPGQAAQLEMAHGLRAPLSPPPPHARLAAVLVLLFPSGLQADNYRLVFIKRSSHDPRDRHAGQISFPGGSVENTDPNLAFTALREAQEEVGVPPKQVEILGKLTTLYIPVSNFLVHPFVAYTPQKPDFKPQSSEVDAILELPLSDFFKPKARVNISKTISNNTSLQQVPCWQIGEHQIWGATAMITSEFLALLQ